MTEFFGDIERFIADLYPFRWPLTFGVLLVVTAITVYGYRKGWHMVVWRHRVAVSIVGTPALAAVVVAGWYVASPLFTSKTVIEEFPFSVNAVVPGDMTRGAVEETMATMSKFDQRMVEAMPGSMTSAARIKSGSFQDADNFHKGSGQATIYRSPDGSHLLRLENLNVTNGPDLHVLLSPHVSPDKGSEVKTKGYVDLGKLKGNKGDQNYPIPDGVDIDIQSSVVIYCKPFSVVFSVAMLQNEEFPLAANATVPPGMSRGEVEQVMSSMAEFDQEVSEAMSDAINSGAMKAVEDGLAITEEGIRSSDGAMVDEGVAMIREAIADPTAQQLAPVRLQTGSFRDADSFHKGSGQATIYRGPDGSRLLRLESLNVTNGPDLHVILTPHENPESRADVSTTGYVDLGKLKGNKGDQNYPIPDDVDVGIQNSVVIYCKPFHVVFSVAPLEEAA